MRTMGSGSDKPARARPMFAGESRDASSVNALARAKLGALGSAATLPSKALRGGVRQVQAALDQIRSRRLDVHVIREGRQFMKRPDLDPSYLRSAIAPK
jgi:hypothetical protein